MSDSRGLATRDVFSLGIAIIGIGRLVYALNGAVYAASTITVARDSESSAYFLHPLYETRIASIFMLKLLLAIAAICFAGKLANRMSSCDAKIRTPRDAFLAVLSIYGVYMLIIGIPDAVSAWAGFFHVGELTGMFYEDMRKAFSVGGWYEGNWLSTLCLSLAPFIGLYLMSGAKALADIAYGRIEQSETEDVVA